MKKKSFIPFYLILVISAVGISVPSIFCRYIVWEPRRGIWCIGSIAYFRHSNTFKHILYIHISQEYLRECDVHVLHVTPGYGFQLMSLGSEVWNDFTKQPVFCFFGCQAIKQSYSSFNTRLSTRGTT